MIFTDYWKVLVLNFSMMRNTLFFSTKKLIERLCLLGSFFQQKSWWKDDICLVFLSFPWYSRTWEIWLLVQCFIMVKAKLSCYIFPKIQIFQPLHIVYSNNVSNLTSNKTIAIIIKILLTKKTFTINRLLFAIFNNSFFCSQVSLRDILFYITGTVL